MFQSSRIKLYNFSLKLGVFSTEPFNYYDDDYYYDYEYKEPASKVQSEDYDLSELVKAWKEYIKEKNFEEKNYECNPKDDSYRTPDSNQCDRYYNKFIIWFFCTRFTRIKEAFNFTLKCYA